MNMNQWNQMINPELLNKIHEEYSDRFYELGQYCSLKETVELHYPIGKIILEYNYDNN